MRESRLQRLHVSSTQLPLLMLVNRYNTLFFYILNHVNTPQRRHLLTTCDIVLNICTKDMWVSKFQRLTADLEDVARQKAMLAHNHKWKAIENLPKLDQLVFETWNAIPDTYTNMKKYAFGVLSIFGSTYVCEQVFSSINYIKNKHRSHLTDDSLQSCVKMRVTTKG